MYVWRADAAHARWPHWRFPFPAVCSGFQLLLRIVVVAPDEVSVAPPGCNWEGGGVMSQQTVGIIIDKLRTDEDLRIRFVVDRIETMQTSAAAVSN